MPVASPVPHRTAAIVFAAGSGNRFGGPKQFEAIGAERLVDRVVRHAGLVCDVVVVVLPEDVSWDGPPVDVAVVGGHTHAESVRNAIGAVPDDVDVILLATAAHPLASTELFVAVRDAVLAGADAATPEGHLADALKRHDDGRIIETVPKAQISAAQSPSAFRASTLRSALAKGLEVPEELQLIEENGGTVVFVPGEATNIHITTPLELAMARCLVDLVDGPPNQVS